MVHIWFGELRVGTVSSSSGVFAGSNKLQKFKQSSKHNQVFGTVEGEFCRVLDTVCVLEDRDEADFNLPRKQTGR